MGTEQQAKMLACQQNHDISEKVMLGLAKPTMSTKATHCPDQCNGKLSTCATQYSLD